MPTPSTDLFAHFTPHPRLLAPAALWSELRALAQADDLLRRFLARLERQALGMESLPTVVHEMEGYRLLAVSRKVLRRVLLLSFQFKLSGEEKFARRAEQEMLAACAFDDWNPAHFLDTAEMTTALAIGYDWLFDVLSPESREAIRVAIIDKGLKPGLDPANVFHRIENNWNQVCWCGMSLGALAIAEDEPALAAQCLGLAKEFNFHGLLPYQPEGVYPEGPMYWGYGTGFQTVLAATLQSTLGTDWGLRDNRAFMQSATALVELTAPSGSWFNFSDCRLRGGIEPAVFWFAQELRQPELLQFEMPKVAAFASAENPAATEKPEDLASEADRLLPLTALWWPGQPAATAQPLPLCWHGDGVNPVAVFRSAWNDPSAAYLAVKGGAAALNHGHMDASSFVFEAGGVRWARDLGLQDYHSLESKNINMWDAAQDGQRWNVFRLGHLSHNTLTINGQRHNVDGHAAITNFSGEGTPGATVNMTAVFAGQATRAARRFTFGPGDSISIEDELDGLAAGDEVRWAMVTSAAITLDGREAVLRQDGRQLRARLLSPLDAHFECLSADPADDFNAPNPDTRILVVTARAPVTGEVRIAVTLTLE